MTACRNKARGAVVAALAGALTLGAAPVMALADGASLMASTESTIWKGIVTYEGEDSYVANGDPQGKEAVSLDPFGDAVPVDLEYFACNSSNPDEGYYYFYVKIDPSSGTTWKSLDGSEYVTYKNADGRDTNLKGDAVAKPSVTGEYAVVSGYWNGSGWELVKTAETFSIKARSLEGAVLAEDGDVDDTAFMWDGTKHGRQLTVAEDGYTTLGERIDVVLDGVVLDRDEDYSVVNFYAKGTDTPVTELVPGTSYTAEIVGMGNYATQTETLEFTLQPLDLSSSTVTGNVTDQELTSTSDIYDVVKSINGVEVGASDDAKIGDGYVAVEFDKGPAGDGIASGTGRYTFSVVPKDLNGAAEGTGNAWVTGSATVEAVRAKYVVEFEVGDNVDAFDDGAYRYDLTKEDAGSFDLEEVTAKTTTGWAIKDDDVHFSVTAADGSDASESDLTKGGTWYVTAEVYYKDSNDELVAGRETFKIVNSYDEVTSSNVYVTLDGKNVDENDPTTSTVTYDGTDWAEKLSVMVAKNDVTLAEGTDYTVTIQDADGKAVDSIVDKGTYKVVVKGITFSGSIDFDIVVEAVKLTAAYPNYDVVTSPKLDTNYDGYFGYTGEVIDATYTFTDADGDVVDVPTSAYKAAYTYDGDKAELKDACKDNKTYEATISDATVNDNYEIGVSAPVKVVVSTDKVFADVPNDEYYTQSVYDAYKQGYIKGMGETNLFMPNKSISRADMVVVLYRMAGGVTSEDWSASWTETAHLSQYADVDAKAYYAQALAWASQAGIVTGYEDGNFGPADAVTVEQYVTMLARYAKVIGNYEAVDTDAVLAGVADGDQVSEFGQDAVAWAVESGYLAQGGADIQPQSPVTRGRAVTIAVRYQPEKAGLVQVNPDAGGDRN